MDWWKAAVSNPVGWRLVVFGLIYGLARLLLRRLGLPPRIKHWTATIVALATLGATPLVGLPNGASRTDMAFAFTLNFLIAAIGLAVLAWALRWIAGHLPSRRRPDPET